MKKYILFTAMLFSALSVINVQAQGTGASKTGDAQLTLNLSAVQSIIVGGDVVIDYATADDYANGKGSTDLTTLTVVSAGGYAITAQAEDLKDATNSTSPIIKSNTIAVTATGLAGATGAGAGTLEQNAAKTALITSAQGGVGLQYTVSYKGTGSNEYMKNYNGGGRQYKTTVVYTIAAI